MNRERLRTGNEWLERRWTQCYWHAVFGSTAISVTRCVGCIQRRLNTGVGCTNYRSRAAAFLLRCRFYALSILRRRRREAFFSCTQCRLHEVSALLRSRLYAVSVLCSIGFTFYTSIQMTAVSVVRSSVGSRRRSN